MEYYKYGITAAAGLLLLKQASNLMREGHSFEASKLCPSRTARKVPPPNQPCAGNLEEFFMNKDKLYIHWRVWKPIPGFHPKPKAIMVICHGLGEHCARYHSLAKEFNKLGIVVYALDHQGHGRSEGDRLYVHKFQDYVDDVLQLTHMAKAQNQGLDTFILGHSMGGAICLETLLQAQRLFKGAILSAPALKEDPAVVGPFLKTVATTLGSFFPRLPLDKLDANMLSRDAQVVDHYKADPLVCTDPVPARLGSLLLRSFEHIHAHASEINTPYILMHGDGDKLTMPEGSKQFHQNSASADKQFKVYNGQYHEIFTEPEQSAKKDTLEWLKARI